MGIMDAIYKNKCNTLISKIDELNKKNREGYKTFKEYVLSDDIMASYFSELKELEKKYSVLRVDSYETFYNRLSEQLNKIYNSMLIDIYQSKEGKERNEALIKLKNDISDSKGHVCDNVVKDILIDLDYKINNAEKFKIRQSFSDLPKSIKTKREVLSEDPLMEEILSFIKDFGKVSASLLQRKFKIGYERAAKIVDILEENGYVSSANGSKPRDVLMTGNGYPANSTKPKLVEMSDEEYKKYLLDKDRKGKSIKEIMHNDYNIDIEYDKKDVFKVLTNSLVTSSLNDSDREQLINNIIKYMSPEKLKMYLISCGQLSFNDYYGLPHLISSIDWDLKKVGFMLELLSKEMDRRYDLFLDNGVKTYDDYYKIDKIPYILILIDEVSGLLNDKNIYNFLIKILLNGTRVGIKVIMFSKFSKKNINLGSIEDLINIYSKFDLDTITNGQNNSINELEEIDNEMSGFDFEKYASELLLANGFNKIKVTSASGDFGVDIIAYKDDVKYAIQCKKYSSSVGIKAIQEVIGSKAMNDCHVAVVLTNSSFTKSAKELAEKNGVLLWGRTKLEQFIENYKQSNKN